MAGKENLNQRIVIRLRRDQLDELRVLDDYDERSKIRGSADHDYIRHLILIGHMFVSAFGTELPGKIVDDVALSSNKSDNTIKQHQPFPYGDGSSVDNTPLARVSEASPQEVVGAAIRQMAGVFGGKGKAS